MQLQNTDSCINTRSHQTKPNLSIKLATQTPKRDVKINKLVAQTDFCKEDWKVSAE